MWEGMRARAEQGGDAKKDEASDADGVKTDRQRELKQKKDDVWMRM